MLSKLSMYRALGVALLFSVVPAAGASLNVAPKAAVQEVRPRVLAIRDVRLEQGDDAPAKMLVLRDGRIEAILDADAEAPAGARVLDGEGRLALPGFIDAFSQRGFEPTEPVKDQDIPVDARSDVRIDMRLANRKGIQPAFSAARVLKLGDEEIQAWREAGFGSALLAPGGELLSGSSALVATRDAAAREAVVAADLFPHAAFAASGSGYPGTLMGYTAQLRQFFLDAERHAELTARYAAGRGGMRPPFDEELEAGGAILAGTNRLVCEAESARDIERWIKLADEFGFEIAISGGRNAWKVADLLAEREIPVLMTLTWGEEVEDPFLGKGKGKKKEASDDETEAEGEAESEADESADEAGEEESEEEADEEGWEYTEPLGVRAEKRREWEESRDSAIALAEAGVAFAFGSDEAKPGELLGKVQDLVDAGLDAELARTALTMGGAELLGVSGILGEIAVGKNATFALWTADPLTDRTAVPTLSVIDGFAEELELDEKKAPKELVEVEPEDPWPHPFATDALREPSFQTGGALLVRNVTIHSAVSPAFVGDVLVSGGDIERIGSDLDAPAGVTIVDGTGKHLAPGAVDTHSHMAIERGVNEGSLSITADCDITDVINADDIGLYRALAGGTTTIQCLHGSANAIGGRSEVLKLRWRVNADALRFPDAPQGIKFALGENPKRSNWGERGVRFPHTRMGVESVFRRAFERAREYAAEWAAYHQAKDAGEDPAPPRRDVRLEVLVDILSGDISVHSHCYRADEILMLMRVAEQYGFQIKTLQHVLEGYKVADEIARHGAGTSTFSDWWGYKLEAYDAIPHNAALLDEAGVVSTINSDSPELVRHLYHEAAKSMRYADIDPVRALRLCTLNAAIQLGVEDRVGSIEEGKDADLVLLDADPLSIYAKVLMTFVDGEIEFERRDAFGLDDANLRVRTLEEALPIEATISEGPAVAIVGGTLHPATGPAIENGTLLLRGGRIEAVGSDIEIPEGAEVVDATGLHVWPGMIALNTPVGLREIGSVRGSVDVAELGGNQPDVRVTASIHPDSAHIPITRLGGVTRAQVAPQGGGPMMGQSATIRLSGETWEEMVVIDRDMLHIRFPGVSNTAEEKEEPEATKELRRLLEEAREYGRLAEGDVAPRFDPRLEALVPFARGEKRIALHVNNAQSILYAIQFVQEEDLDAVLFGVREGWKVADAIAESGLPTVTGPVLTMPRSRYEPYEAPYANAAVLHRAGVRVVIQPSESENVRNLGIHAGMASEFGLPRLEALRAVTQYPAEILGLEHELGSLSAGKRADIVMTDGDLFEPGTKVLAILIDGEPQEMTTRQTELYDRYHERLHRAQGR